MYDIPLSIPVINEEEKSFVNDCLDSGWVSSAGKYVEEFEKGISDYVDSKYAIACVNGTSALQISLIVAGVDEGDEVIVPTLTFIASVNPISYLGASPIFMDSNNFFLLDIDKTIHFLKNETIFKNGYTYNKKTKKRIKAIITVHVWGNAIFFDDLNHICREMNITIIEDAAESLGSKYISGNFEGRHTGTIGSVSCYSFNGNKIITTGGGGMIVTDDEKIAEKSRYLTTQAKDDAKKYIHNEIGYNFRLTNIQAALGLGQLKNLDMILKKKTSIFKKYKNILKKINGLSIYDVPNYAQNNHWINMLRVDQEIYGKSAADLHKIFEYNKIETRPVWFLNHMQKPYTGSQSYQIEKANSLIENSLCMPSSINLSNQNFDTIFEVLNG